VSEEEAMSKQAPDLEALGQATRRLMENFSVEVTPREAEKQDTLREALRPGAPVYITYLPDSDLNDTISAARRIADIGLRPVPHLPARGFESERQLDDALNRLTGDARVTEVLVIAGSVKRQLGPFSSSTDLLRTGLVQRYGITTVGVAGHPEGNPDIDAAALAQAIADKNAFAKETGLRMQLVTQFSFAPEPIVAWERALREGGNELPVHVGVPGVASAATLLKFGIACGVGASLAVVRKQAGNVLKLASAKPQHPDTVVLGVAAAGLADPAAVFESFHFFPFGALKRTSAWAAKIRDGNFELSSDGEHLTATE
jgi:methylenetetrahydrofolate reductase (NADPH)